MDNVERFEANYGERDNYPDEDIGTYLKNDYHQPINSVAKYDTPNLDVINGSKSNTDISPSYTSNREYFNVDDEVDKSCDNANGTCFNRDKLLSSDLLPANPGNSKWGEMNPTNGGLITDQSFLTAGYHIGINTIGQSLRNANLQLRSEPANPQIPVSPWGISTIEPDIRQVGFEIGSGASK